LSRWPTRWLLDALFSRFEGHEGHFSHATAADPEGMVAVGKGWKAGWKINFNSTRFYVGNTVGNVILAILAGLVSGK